MAEAEVSVAGLDPQALIEARSRPAGGLRWVFPPRFMPFWYAALAWGWWQVFFAEVAVAPWPGVAGLAALATMLPKLAGFASEALFYRLFWASRGLALPYWRFFAVVVSASMADLLAHAMVEVAEAHPSAASWFAPVAGLQLWQGSPFHDHAAVRAAFGTVGLLTGVRISLTAWAQSEALRIGIVRALGWTTLVWLASRIALFWMADLLRGMSPLGG